MEVRSKATFYKSRVMRGCKQVCQEAGYNGDPLVRQSKLGSLSQELEIISLGFSLDSDLRGDFANQIIRNIVLGSLYEVQNEIDSGTEKPQKAKRDRVKQSDRWSRLAQEVTE